MKSLFRNSIIAAVVLLTLAPAAVAGPCPAPPYSVCEPFSTSGLWFSDATKTVVVGGWNRTCPDVNTCIAQQTAWGERTNYSEVDCEPCDPCGSCNYARSTEENDDSCILEAELKEVEETEQTARAEEEGAV
jgi:hypothetical protein